MGFLVHTVRLAGCVALALLGLRPVVGRAQTAPRPARPELAPTAAAPRPPAPVAPSNDTGAGTRAGTATGTGTGTGTGVAGKGAPVLAPTALSAQSQITSDSIYADPPVAAVFPGGMPALGAYIGTNMRFPEKARENGVTGRVLVQFILGKQGQVQDVHVVSGPGSGLNEEAYRLVWLMPRWEPGRLANGQPVRVNCTLPIMFRAAEK